MTQEQECSQMLPSCEQKALKGLLMSYNSLSVPIVMSSQSYAASPAALPVLLPEAVKYPSPRGLKGQ